MSKSYNIAVPRYYVRGLKQEVFDVFNKKTNAIKAAIAMAVEYPGATFQVTKKAFRKETIVFSFKIDLKMDFEDLQDVYREIIEVYQKKLSKTRFWRKADEDGA